MHRTNIEWTDLAANPLQYRDKAGKVVWGCVKHSTGCAHCYAEQLAVRYNRGGPFTAATMRDLTPFLDEKELRHILTAKVIDKKSVTGSRCFLGDMTDVFGEWVSGELLDQLFAVLALRPDVTFQVLTKRAGRMAHYFGTGRPWERISNRMREHNQYSSAATEVFRRDRWPLPNVHLGTSVENQAAADDRIPHLLRVPAAVRFLSCEPLLGPVSIQSYLYEANREARAERIAARGERVTGDGPETPPGIDWAIVGGESGPGARPMQVEWARSLVQQCKAAGVACFVKQMGERPIRADGRPLGAYDAAEGEFPRCSRCGHFDFGPCGDGTLLCNGCDSPWGGLRDKKGGDPDEWPADLRVREFPPAVS